MSTNGISFLAGTTSQSSRLLTLNQQMQQLEQQLTTQKKTDTYAGLGGVDAKAVQGYHMDTSLLNAYQSNITTATTRINLMTQDLTQAGSTAGGLVGAIQGTLGVSPVDISTVKNLATQGIGLLNDMMNQNIDGRYLFSGSQTATPPLQNTTTASAAMQTQMTNWLNGTTTTAQLLTNISNMTPAQLGFDPALSSAGPVTMAIDSGTNVDYTSIASNNGFQQLYAVMQAAANIQIPSSSDAATPADLDNLLSGLNTMATNAESTINANNAKLGASYNQMKTIGDDHTQDINTLATLLSSKEDADQTQVSVQITALQTQLQASYQVTNIVNQLSLVNFLS